MMKVDASINKDMALNIKTKDGDTLSFSMYDKKSMEAKHTQDGTTLRLKSQIGFEFNYTGNGLSKEDIKEIKEAVKLAGPDLNNFLENSRVKELDPEHIIKTALKIGNALPKDMNEDQKKGLMGELVKDMGEKLNSQLEKVKAPDMDEIRKKMLEDSKKMLEELWENIKKQKDQGEKDISKGIYA